MYTSENFNPYTEISTTIFYVKLLVFFSYTILKNY